MRSNRPTWIIVSSIIPNSSFHERFKYQQYIYEAWISINCFRKEFINITRNKHRCVESFPLVYEPSKNGSRGIIYDCMKRGMEYSLVFITRSNLVHFVKYLLHAVRLTIQRRIYPSCTRQPYNTKPDSFLHITSYHLARSQPSSNSRRERHITRSTAHHCTEHTFTLHELDSLLYEASLHLARSSSHEFT